MRSTENRDGVCIVAFCVAVLALVFWVGARQANAQGGGGIAQAPSFGATQVFNFQGAGVGPLGFASWATDAAGCDSSTVSGPQSIGYTVCAVPFSSNGDAAMFQWLAPRTWNGAAGTVDVNAMFWQNSNDNGDSWAFRFYLGCASAIDGTFVYGATSVVGGTEPDLGFYQGFGVSSIRLPASGCSGGSLLQAWIVRAQAGTVGIPKLVSFQATMRGN